MLTWRSPISFLYEHILGHLALPDCPQNRQSLPYARNPNIPERLVVQVSEDLARDTMVCAAPASSRVSSVPPSGRRGAGEARPALRGSGSQQAETS